MAEATQSGIAGWLKSHLPTRESLAANRWTKPFARQLLRRDLWRFNRRSVPRGVAVGLFMGPILPVAHTIPAVFLAVPTRANIVIAAATTWVVSNPLTYIPLYAVAGILGRFVLGTDAETAKAAIRAAWQTGWRETFLCLLNEGKVFALGVLILSVLLAAAGYLASSFFWRWKIGREWRKRRVIRQLQ